jgi:Putative cyclase
MPADSEWVAFDELPLLGESGIRRSWEVFGAGDTLGTLNLITADIRVEALASAVTGQVVNVSLPLTEPRPPMFGRRTYNHVILHNNPNANDDYVDHLYLQVSSQWDGLRHIRGGEQGYYGGYTGEFSTADTETLGIQHWAQAGIVGRGVLIDLPRYHASHRLPYAADAGIAVQPGVVAAAAAECGVQFRPGDILCLYFGWLDSYLAIDPADRGNAAIRQKFSGLSAAEDTPRFLWDSKIAAVAADNPAVEVSPGDPQVGSLHQRLIPALGFAIGELFDFRELARACEVRKRWDFLFMSVPLNFPGGVGSPANALAVI